MLFFALAFAAPDAPELSLRWSKEITELSLPESPMWLCTTWLDGDVVVAGFSDGAVDFEADAHIVRLRPDGSTVWQTVVPLGSQPGWKAVPSCAIDSGSPLLITSTQGSMAFEAASGSLLWSRPSFGPEVPQVLLGRRGGAAVFTNNQDDTKIMEIDATTGVVGSQWQLPPGSFPRDQVWLSTDGTRVAGRTRDDVWTVALSAGSSPTLVFDAPEVDYPAMVTVHHPRDEPLSTGERGDTFTVEQSVGTQLEVSFTRLGLDGAQRSKVVRTKATPDLYIEGSAAGLVEIERLPNGRRVWGVSEDGTRAWSRDLEEIEVRASSVDGFVLLECEAGLSRRYLLIEPKSGRVVWAVDNTGSHPRNRESVLDIAVEKGVVALLLPRGARTSYLYLSALP